MRTEDAMVLAAKICPKAPPGAVGPTNEITGYVLWAVIVIFGLGIIVGLGAIVGGRMVGMRHASAVGVVGIVMVFGAVLAYLVLPGVLDGMLGKGCV